MNFPQYHVPDTAVTLGMLVAPVILGLVALAAIVYFFVFSGRTKQKHAESIATIAFSVFVVVSIAAVCSFLFAHAKAESNDRKVAVSKYYGDVSSYIDKVYGVKITKDSARDLISGDETAGLAPTGETITLSLLNRDQKNPVLIGTDHNPIPKYERLTAK